MKFFCKRKRGLESTQDWPIWLLSNMYCPYFFWHFVNVTPTNWADTSHQLLQKSS